LVLLKVHFCVINYTQSYNVQIFLYYSSFISSLLKNLCERYYNNEKVALKLLQNTIICKKRKINKVEKKGL
jgi:hypothetical protein